MSLPVADRPFVDRPPGDVAAADRLARRTAAELGLPRPELVKLGMNATFAAGDVVIRVGRPTAPASAAYELAAVLSESGIRVPHPAGGHILVDDSDDDEQPLTATIWERLHPVGAGPDWHAVGQMVSRVNDLERAALPPAYPLPWCTGFPWWRFDDLLADVRSDVDIGAHDALRSAVDRNRELVDGVTEGVVCHGDVHPGNVVATADGPVIVDWDLLCIGPIAFDHAPLLSMVARWGTAPEAYERFAAGYGVDLGHDPTAKGWCELRLVAATLMRIIAGRDDPVARAEAERRLGWWRGEPDAPTWAPA